nr:hypothetical protein [Tanacetum cinerariifolium]
LVLLIYEVARPEPNIPLRANLGVLHKLQFLEQSATRMETQNQGDVNDVLGYKKKAVVLNSYPLALVAKKMNVNKQKEKKANEKKRDMSKVKCYNCKKEGHFAKDYKKAKDQAWMESSSDSNQEINANMVFMAQIKKVLSESEKSSSSAEETIAEVAYYTYESESESEFETLE